MKTIKDIIRLPIYIISFLFILPLVCLNRMRLISFWTSGNILSLIPGMIGVFIRRVWYKISLKKCGIDLFVDFLGVIRTKKARIGNNVYIGEKSIIGNCDIGDDVIVSHNCNIMSGKMQHGMALNKPIRLQMGNGLNPSIRTIIGKDCFIGLNVVIAVSIPDGVIVGANSFVNKTFDPYSIIGGNPAGFLKSRE